MLPSKGDVKRVLENASDYEWTLQGFGMLRTYLEGDDLRLNVWDNRYAVDDYSAIHDHPWRFVSCIYAGRLLNQRFVPHMMGQLYNQVLIKPGEGGGPIAVPGKIALRAQRVEIYQPGEYYGQECDELHRTSFDDGTVTVIERERNAVSDEALSIWEGTGEWVSAEPKPATVEQIETMITHALKTF